MAVIDRDASSMDALSALRGFMRLSDRHTKQPLVIDHGQGIWVFDQTGRPYLEAASGMWCAAFGFGDEELVEAAMRQLRRLPYYHTLLDKTVGPAAELAHKLASLVPMASPKVHLAVSGSEANDYTIKFLRFANNARGLPAKKKIIARINGYHGATLAASSLTGLPQHHRMFDLPLPGILHTSDPHYYRDRIAGETAEEFGHRLADQLEQLILIEGPDTVAGFMIEPVTGGGGVVIPPPSYYPAVQEVLSRYDVALLADEIITGFYRTGRMFGVQTFGITPETMSLGKGLSAGYQPIAAVVVSGDLYDAMEHGSDTVGVFAHGATHSGHPVAAAVSLRAIELMDERGMEGHVAEIAPRFAARLAALRSHPLVGDARWVGLLGAVEFVVGADSTDASSAPGSFAKTLGAACLHHGLIVRVAGTGDVISFSPPLIITGDEIDELFDRFEAALRSVEAEAPTTAR